MKNRFQTFAKKFIPPLIVILLFPIVVALLFLPESFLYIPPEGITSKWPAIILAIIFVTVIFFFTKRRTRNYDLISQKLLLAVIMPTPIGFGLYFIFGKPILFISGMILSVLIGTWINYLRFPLRFWQTVRLVRQNNRLKALQVLSSWIQTHSDDWKAFKLRADLYLQELKLANAEHDARVVIKLRSGRHHEDYYQLAQILHLQSMYEEAKDAVSTAINIKSNSSYYYTLGVECYRLEQYQEAIEAFNIATRSTLPLVISNLMANYYLGSILEKTGRKDDAYKHFMIMWKYSYNLKQYADQLKALPDYPEIMKLRDEYADIEQRLSEKIDK